MISPSKEDAVELFLHQIASALHAAMAHSGVTYSALCVKMEDIGESAEPIEALLRGSYKAGEVSTRYIAELFWVLDFKPQIQLSRIEKLDTSSLMDKR